jgi:hypothetical protein
MFATHPLPLPFEPTVTEARAEVALKRIEGTPCPVCDQHVQVYRRKITRPMVKSLIALYRAAGLTYAHIPTVLGRDSAEESKLRYWSLLQEERKVRPDGGRAGYWRVTPLAVDWLEGRATVQKYALIYNGEWLGYEGGVVTAAEAFGVGFNLRDLLDGV